MRNALTLSLPAASVRHDRPALDRVASLLSLPSLAMRYWSRLPPLLRSWLLSFLGWGLVAFSMGAEEAAHHAHSLTHGLHMSLRDWLPWAVLTPLIFQLVARLPIDRHRWKIALPVHLVCGVAAVLLCQWWKMTMDLAWGPPLPPGWPPGPPPGPGGFDMLHFASFEIPIYLMLASAAHALLFSRRTRDRETSLARALSEAQKMQLQPHFLFNTLNMIAELVHSDADRADAMLMALSDLLRLTMDTAGEQELPLKRELEFIERYLAIMHARFEDRVQFQLGIDPATTMALVPTFLLQPLVENAVEHGLGSRQEGGLITIRSRKVGKTLHLSVSDNGIGRPEGKSDRVGLGLGNTRGRLRELYGEAGQLALHDAGGLIVEIAIPFHTA